MIGWRLSAFRNVLMVTLMIGWSHAAAGQVTWAGDPGASTQIWTERNVGIVPSGTSYVFQYPFFVGRDGVRLGSLDAWITGLYLNSTGRGIWFGHGPSTGDAIGIIAGQGSPSSIAFWTNNGFTWGERIRVAPNGYVGIGITAPSKQLHVAGDIEVDGTVNAKWGQDLAEWVPASADLSPAMVVVIDGSAVNSVIPSECAYETRVAGVVAERPGIVLGERGAGMEMIATTGRVKVRVDASAAPIGIGDLLVTSSTPGAAMRSEAVAVNGIEFHRPGTILGKALEPLDSGHGEILVLLSLQ